MLSKLDQISNLNALVVGDVMIDAYLFGEVERMSPEAPVPVINKTGTDERVGGAANVAKNINSLGANAHLACVIGEDEAGTRLLKMLESNGIGSGACIREASRFTTIKTRIISNNEHMLRVDEESISPISDITLKQVQSACKHILDNENIDVIIVEDYNKGLLDERLFKFLKEQSLFHNIPLTVDPKLDNFSMYRDVDLFKPNLKELTFGINTNTTTDDLSSIKTAVQTMDEELRPVISLTTLGDRGVWVHSPSKGENHVHIDAHKRNIIDVSGAGDTVIATASLMLASGATPFELAHVANIAGGLVCESSGVVEIDLASLKKEVEKTIS